MHNSHKHSRVHCKNKQSIWLLQLRGCPSRANSKNLVLVKHFVGGIKYQLPLHEFFSSTTFMKFDSHTIVVTKYFAKIKNLFLLWRAS